MFSKWKNMSLKAARAQLLFNDWNQLKNIVVLDTETTGIKNAEICEVAVLDLQGNILFESLVKPASPIPLKAQNIHGITDSMVDNSPNWIEVWDKLYPLIKTKIVLIYNDEFDKRLMIESFKPYEKEASTKTKMRQVNKLNTQCVMRAYSNLVDSSKWVKLTVACGHPTDHRAIGDCHATIEVVRNNLRSDFSVQDFHYLKWLSEIQETNNKISTISQQLKLLTEEQVSLLQKQQSLIEQMTTGDFNQETEIAATKKDDPI
jgi:DNA polymerase-3 subunit epsilon